MNRCPQIPARLAAMVLVAIVSWAGPPAAADEQPAPQSPAPAQDAPSPAASDETAPAAESLPVMVVFDFTSSPDAETGRKLADALRLRAARLGQLTMIDTLSTRDALAEGESPTAESPPEQVAWLASERFGAQLALWGSVAKAEDGTCTIAARGLDLRPGAERPLLRKTVTAEKPQMVNARCDEILAELTGLQKRARPREADPEAAARAKVRPKNLVTNGDFEAPGDQPRGWEAIDGLTTFLRQDDKQHGRVLHMDTDVYESEHNRWREQLKAGASPAEAPKKTPTRGPKYDTVGGNYGVHNYSDPIPVTPGTTYRIEIDYRCKTSDFFFPKLFFRGWAEVNGEERIVYDGYLSLRSMEETGRWKHNCRLLTVPLPEEVHGRRIKYLRLMIYAYWPPGDCYFDNAGLYEVIEPEPAGTK